jgi:large subunit ribosomal protein L18
MAQGPRYDVPYRRRRAGKTDYRQRLALLKSGKPRLVVRETNRNVTAQFVTYDPDGDRVVAQAEALELEDLGWEGYTSNTPSAYLTGLLAAQRGREAGVDEAVLDLGLQKPSEGGVVFAALRGALDAGVEVPHGDGIFPTPDRLQGAHIDSETPENFADVHEEITGEPPEGDLAPSEPEPEDASDDEEE